MSLRIQRIAHGVVRRLGQLFVDARDQNVVVRIGVRIGLLWIQPGLHCRSLFSPMSPAAGRDLSFSRQGFSPPLHPVCPTQGGTMERTWPRELVSDLPGGT